MKLQRPLKKAARGFTLIELLLVIGFIAGALVLAFVTFPKVQAASRANTESQHITTLVAGIKNLYATAQSYSSLTNSVLLAAKVFPDDMQVSGSTVNNVWGGTVAVTPTAGPSGGTNLAYLITYQGVPQNECNKLATGVASNYLKETVAGTTVMDKTASTQVNIDPGVVAAQCSGNNNTIVIEAN
jgi:type II secretory pathway pseudopilin PulG